MSIEYDACSVCDMCEQEAACAVFSYRAAHGYGRRGNHRIARLLSLGGKPVVLDRLG